MTQLKRDNWSKDILLLKNNFFNRLDLFIFINFKQSMLKELIELGAYKEQ